MVTYEITRSSLTKKKYNNYKIKSASQEADQEKDTEAIAKILAQMIIDKQKKLSKEKMSGSNCPNE